MSTLIYFKILSSITIIDIKEVNVCWVSTLFNDQMFHFAYLNSFSVVSLCEVALKDWQKYIKPSNMLTEPSSLPILRNFVGKTLMCSPLFLLCDCANGCTVGLSIELFRLKIPPGL